MTTSKTTRTKIPRTERKRTRTGRNNRPTKPDPTSAIMSESQQHPEIVDKELALERTLLSLGAVIVAYSGGVDSAYLACVANRTLGDRAWAITADSPSY